MKDLTVLIKKLGHNLEEIRLRSLQSILSKLELGLLNEHELLHQDSIFNKLVEWFSFDSVPEQHKVLQLILRLIKAEGGAGAQLLIHADPGLCHLREVKGHDAILQDIINGTSHLSSHDNSVSPDEQDDGKKLNSFDIKYSEPADNKLQISTKTGSNDLLSCFHIWSLPEVPLVSGDLNVLDAIEESLHDVTIAEKTCHFFSTVILQDFPPETFLHHPGIIKGLLDLISEAPQISTAAVKCLSDFTFALHTQLNYHCDPATASLKHTVYQVSERSEDNAPDCEDMRNATFSTYNQRDKDHNQRGRPSQLKLSQISIPQFCVITLHYVASLCGSSQNIGSPLMPRLLRLFRACLADAKLVWTSQHFVIRDLIQYIYETMVKLGFAIKHSIVQVPVMRVHVITATTQLLKAIVPLNIATSVVPNILKEAITSCILDPAVIILYPHIHKLLLKYNAACKLDAESMYNDVKRVTDSMQSSIQFIRKAGIITATEALAFFEASMLSLPFHKHLHMISLFIQLCIEKWKLNNKETEVASRIVCMLLAHTETDITLETYKVVHKNIICFFGPEQAAKILDPTLQLSFILTPKVFTEIVCHGTTHVDTQIQQYACDILTYILKCRMLIPETSWLKILSAMAPVLPLLQCHAGKSMPLQRTVINILDPDISKTIGLSELQVISGNIRLMFSKDRISREEGVARLVWLLSLGESVHSNLADICMIEKCLTSKQLVNVYDIGSIVRVLEVLTGTCADDRVCQSALTQISVMTEDPQLHSIFLEYHGLPVLLKIFTSSMENVEAAGGCAIPIVATMKNLSRHSAKVREELSQNVTFYCNIVRALFRLSEWRLQRDGTQLLALLVYADYIISTSDYISFPQIVTEKMHLPFDTKSHWSVSINVQPTLRGVLLGNKEVQNVLSLQWAIAREDIHSVLNWLQPPADLPKDLVLPKYVLCSLQQSSVKLNCNGLLHAIQNATTHGAVIDAICDLYRFIELSWMCKAGELSQLPWQETFSRFILSSPSCLQDYQLLLIVLRFLTFLAAVQKDQVTWMRHSLCAVPNALIKLLIDANIDTTSQEDGLHDLWKEVCLEVLSLSEKCMKNGEMKGWEVLTNSIVHCLDSSRQKNFYCLALLDRRLRCLQIQLSLHPVDSSILWQLITAFHCDNELSCMGLSITRQTLFCLNCLLINNHSTQNWEDLWIKPENMRWLPSLWKSRDFLVRASTLQLIAGLCISSRGTMVVSKYLDSIWEISLGFVVDQTEASLVREQAAVLLSNISRHIEQQGMRKIYVKMAEDAGLYQELAIAVTQLTLEPKIEFELTLHLPNCLLPVSPRQETTDSELTDAELLPTTPGFIKAGCFLLNNIIALSEDDCIKYINSQGLSKVLFTCLLEQRKLVNAESLEMMSAMMNLLCYCVETYDNLPVDLAYTLINFLDPSFISGLKQESKIQEESVKRFYQETLKLLAVITANSEISISPVSKGVVDTLCECLDQTDSVSLKRTAILVIPSVITIIPTDLSAYICKALLKQWDLHMQKKKLNLLKALSCLVEQSEEATAVALQEGLLQHLIKMLRHNIVAFTVDAGVILKSTKGNSSLNNMLLYFDTINNFMAGSAQVKLAAEQLELADIVHKLWVWCQTDTKIIVAALNMLITFTANCPQAARSLVMTSTLAGVGQRKSPSSLSLVHAVICLLTKEFHPLIVCKHALLLLSHLCQAPECRAVISKSMLLQRFVNVLQDKKQIGKEAEYMWLQFLKIFTYFPEGQHCVIETEELFELLLKQSVASSHSRNRVLATFVIHNVGFSLSNRTRLLTSKSFLKFICEKLLTGEHEEKEYVSIIIWALIANNQKAKVILRNLQILNHLQLASATHSCEVFGVVRSLLENDSTS